MAAFQLKQFSVNHSQSAMKIGTDSILLGSYANSINPVWRVLDIGSGCGILSLMCAQKFMSANIFAVEIELDASMECSENFVLSPWANRLQCFHQDIRFFEQTNFDLIISNPPYFQNSLQSANQKRTTARHNHYLNYSTLFECSSNAISVEGSFFVIIPFQDKKVVLFEAGSFGFYLNSSLSIRNSESNPFKRIILEFKKVIPIYLKEQTLTIRDNLGNYTQEFCDLTFDYYPEKNLFHKE